jgi:hypothetical protein
MHNCWPCSELMAVKPMDQSPTGTYQPFFTVHCRTIYKYGAGIWTLLKMRVNLVQYCQVQMVGGLCHGYIWNGSNHAPPPPYHFWKYIVEKDISFYVAPLNPYYLEQEGRWSRIFKVFQQKNQNNFFIFFSFTNIQNLYVIKYVIFFFISVSNRIVWEYIFYVTDGNIMYLTDASRFLISCVIQHYAPVVGWGRRRNRCIMLIMTLDPS